MCVWDRWTLLSWYFFLCILPSSFNLSLLENVASFIHRFQGNFSWHNWFWGLFGLIILFGLKFMQVIRDITQIAISSVLYGFFFFFFEQQHWKSIRFILRKKMGFCRHFHFLNIKHFFFIKYMFLMNSSLSYLCKFISRKRSRQNRNWKMLNILCSFEGHSSMQKEKDWSGFRKMGWLKIEKNIFYN